MVCSGEVAWVTGSSTGIGRAIALKLADRGCDVTVHYNRSEKEAKEISERIRASGRDTLLVQGDVAEAEDVARMVREIEDRYGRLDILVNNAGSIGERATLDGTTENLWDSTVGVNLKSVYLCSRAVLHLINGKA